MSVSKEDKTNINSKEPKIKNKTATDKKSNLKENGKASKLQKDIEKLREENAQLKDQLLRKIAEFDNFRKRTEKEVGQIILRASESLVTELIPIIDDLERPLNHVVEKDQEETLRAGIELIYAKFWKILEKAGLKLIESDGKEFDPKLHDAMLQVESKEFPSNHVVQTFEKGYKLRDKVIRHAKVSVSK